jgi:hypothetical protein
MRAGSPLKSNPKKYDALRRPSPHAATAPGTDLGSKREAPLPGQVTGQVKGPDDTRGHRFLFRNPVPFVPPVRDAHGPDIYCLFVPLSLVDKRAGFQHINSMSNILDGLTSGSPAPAGAAPAPGGAPTPTPNPTSGVPDPSNLAAAAKDPAAQRPLAVLKAVALGQLPGVLIPKDAPKMQSSLTPGDVTSLGIGIYVPHTKGIHAIFFNQKSVPTSTLKALDKAGKLKTAFPSIMSFLSGKGAAPASPADEPTPVSGISDNNLTGSAGPMPSVVPVLPRPSFSADASKQMAMRRVNALNGSPSSQTLPGGGSVLNGLLHRTI